MESKSLGEKVTENHFSTQLGWMRCCPKCGGNTSTIYDSDKSIGHSFVGNECRECLLIWTIAEESGTFTLVGKPWQPKDKTRTYEIVVTYREYFVEAATADEARLKLIKRLGLKVKSGEQYSVSVKHCMDHAECNEGIM